MSGSSSPGESPGDKARRKLGDAPYAGRFEGVIDAVEKAAAEILGEAEAEAQRRIDAAQARADALVEERAAEVARMSDALVNRAGSVRERADQLLESIESAISEVGSHVPARPVESDKPVEPVESRPPESRPEPVAEREPDLPPEPEADPIRSLRERLSAIGRPPWQVPLGPPDPPPGIEPAEEPVEASVSAPPSPPPRPSSTSGATEGAVLLATQMAVAGASRDQIEARLRKDFGIEDPSPILDRISP